VGRSYKEDAQEKIDVVRDSNQSIERIFKNKVRHQSERQEISFFHLQHLDIKVSQRGDNEYLTKE
jgi:hypothetical protein